MAGLVRQLFGGARTYVPKQSLAPDSWCSAPAVGRMSLVWPWSSVEDPAALRDLYGREVGVRPALALRAPRTDRDVSMTVWIEHGGAGVAGPDWAASVARAYQGRLQSGARIALDGVTGHLARVTHGQDVTWRVIVPRFDRSVHIEMTAPLPHADAYWVQVESMLATWQWED